MSFKTKIFTVPGLGSSGPLHWQSVWEEEFDIKRIEQRDWEHPVCGEWVEKIDSVVADDTDIILVGHSLGCVTIVEWAKRYGKMIKAALLVAPCDTEQVDFPKVTEDFTPMPEYKLPFPSVMIVSDDDTYINIARGNYFATKWGSDLIVMNKLGHINSMSNLGRWNEGLKALERLDSLG